MGRPIKKAKSETIDSGYDNPAGESNTYGVVGGDTALTKPTIACRVKIGANPEADGFIVRQKSTRKFLVSDGTNVGVCLLSDIDDGSLTDGAMTITVTKVDTSTTRLSKMSGRHGLDFAGNKFILTANSAGNAPAGSLVSIAKVNTL